MYKFLALLPAILSFTGFVIYLTTKRNKDSSSLVKSIIDTIKSKSSDTVEIDERLGPRQVYRLINTHAEFREKLSLNDYNLLSEIIKSEQRKNIIYGVITLILVGLSLYAFFKVEQYQNELTIDEVKLKGEFGNKKMNVATTKDNLVFTWNYKGNDDEIKITLTSISNNQTTAAFTCKASDGTFTIYKSHLSELWGCPLLDDKFPVRVSFQTKKNNHSFGPFEIATALTVLYHLNMDSKKVEVFTQTMNCGLLNSDYNFKVVAWSKEKVRLESLDISVQNGKGSGQFPEDFEIDKSSIKTVYMGEYSNPLIRIEAL